MRKDEGRSIARRPRRPRKWITDDFGNISLYKQCAVCDGWKVIDEGFYTDHQYGTCILCKRAQHKIWREEHSEERKQYQRDWYQRIKDDPYWKAQNEKRRPRYYPVDPAKRREWDKAYRARIYADAQRHADWLAGHRIRNALRRDKQGLPLFPERGRHNLLYPEHEENPTILLPIGPISDWLRKRVVQLGTIEAVSVETGVPERRITAYKNRHHESAELDIIEKLLAPSGTLIEDLYPDIDRLIAA